MTQQSCFLLRRAMFLPLEQHLAHHLAETSITPRYKMSVEQRLRNIRVLATGDLVLEIDAVGGVVNALCWGCWVTM